MEDEFLNSKLIDKNLLRINGLYHKWYEKKNFNPYEIQILNAMYNGSKTQKKICEETEMPKQTVNTIVKRLEMEKYITLESTEFNKKEKQIAFTEKGKEYVKKILTPFINLETSIIKKMGKEQTKIFIDILENYASILERKINEEEID